MRHQTIGPRKALNKAFLKQKPERKAIEGFKAALIGMLEEGLVEGFAGPYGLVAHRMGG